MGVFYGLRREMNTEKSPAFGSTLGGGSPIRRARTTSRLRPGRQTMETLRKFFDRDQFARLAGIELLELQPGRATARMTLRPTHWNGIDVAHGGAIFTLADFVFAAASNSHGTVAVAINVSISFLKAARTGTLTAEAREVAKNFKLGSYQVEVKDEQGELIAIFQGMAYRKQDKIPA
jgi:acyl-CoA thioesterase